MKKVKLIKINEYDYVFEDSNSKIYNLNIEFHGNIVPKEGDIIFFPDTILNEKNLYAYGPFKEDKNLSDDDLIKVVSSKGEYYLQRYYG